MVFDLLIDVTRQGGDCIFYAAKLSAKDMDDACDQARAYANNQGTTPYMIQHITGDRTVEQIKEIVTGNNLSAESTIVWLDYEQTKRCCGAEAADLLSKNIRKPMQLGR